MTVTASDLMNARTSLKRLESQFQKQQAINQVAQLIASDQYPIQEIMGQSRKWPLPDLRKIVAYNVHKLGYSLSEIGRFMNKDHTSILYMVREYEKMIGFDDNFTTLADQAEKGIDDLVLKSNGHD